MARTLDTRELTELLGSLTQFNALQELGVLVGCLALAWLVVRLLRGAVPPVGSIWFGRRIFDGVLFPVLALTLAFGAKLATANVLKPVVFKLAIPILLSLVIIRLSVRVLSATFPASGWVRAIEKRSPGWPGLQSCCGSPARCRWCWRRWTM